MHVPVSFSAACNVDGVETCHVSSEDPGELISQSVAILLEMCEKKYRAAVGRFEYIFHQLEQLKVQEMHRLEESNGAGVICLDDDNDDVEMDNDDNVMSQSMKKSDKLYKSLRRIVRSWLSSVLILLAMALNSSRSIYLKNCVKGMNHLVSLSRNTESIPA